MNTNYHHRNIMKQPVGSTCRMCCKAEEHTKHIAVGCTTVVPAECTKRHNKVAGYIHWTVCNLQGPSLSMVPPLCGTYRLSPDTVLHDEKEKTCPLIDIATPDDSNFNTKQTAKVREKGLEIELSRSWKLRKKIVPVIIGAVGTIK